MTTLETWSGDEVCGVVEFGLFMQVYGENAARLSKGCTEFESFRTRAERGEGVL